MEMSIKPRIADVPCLASFCWSVGAWQSEADGSMAEFHHLVKK